MQDRLHRIGCLRHHLLRRLHRRLMPVRIERICCLDKRRMAQVAGATALWAWVGGVASVRVSSRWGVCGVGGTPTAAPPPWIPAFAGMTGRCAAALWGEGCGVGGGGDVGRTGWGMPRSAPPPWIPAFAGMTVGGCGSHGCAKVSFRGKDGRGAGRTGGGRNPGGWLALYFRSNDWSLRDRLVGVAGGAEGLAAWPGYAAARLLARSAGPGARVRKLRT